MSFVNRNILLFRILFVASAIILTALTVISFIINTSATLDENLFVPIPSHIYVTKNIAAQIPRKPDEPESKLPNIDTIRPGWFILRINDHLVNGTEEVRKALSQSRANDTVEIVATFAESFRYGTAYKFRVIKSGIPDSFFTYVPTGALIVDVTEGGASARAGMKTGDLIIKVWGRSFRDAYQADSIMRSQHSGNIISYTLKRDNIDFDINVKLSSFGITFSYLAVLVSGLSIFVLGFYIGVRRPQIKAARLLGLAFICIGFAFINPIDRFIANVEPMIRYIALIRMLLVLTGIPLLMHSTLYFPKERTDLLSKKWVIRTPYIISLVLIAIMSLEMLRLVSFKMPMYLSFEYLFLVFVVFKVVVDLIYRKGKTAEQKQLRKALRLPAIILLLALPVTYYATIRRITPLLDTSSLLLLTIPIAYIYTIGRYHLLDLDIKIRRNILYILSTVAWNLAAAAMLVGILLGISTIDFPMPNLHLTGSSIELIDRPLEENLRLFYEKFVIAAISVLAVIVFWKIKKFISGKLDRKFYRIRFDYRRATTDFSDILASNLTISDLAAGIVKELGELVQLKRVGILIFRNEEKVSEQNYYGFSNDSLREFCFATGAKLIDAIKQFHGEFRVDYLPEPMKSIFKKCDFRYIIPIRSKGRIISALLIGEKRSEASFRREDLAFLSSIAGQSSVALENAMLYEDLAIQERIKHELDLARRIQLASLPQDIPDIAGLDISGISLPALEVGGDFYDFLNGNSNELTVIIGDVSGKGTSAALYMSKVQGIMRTLHEFDLSPRKLFIRTNELLYKYLEKSSFISAIGATISVAQRKIQLSRAGHLPLLYYKAATGRIDRVIPKGLVLGLSKDSLFERNLEEIEISFESGDVFLFVTDGIIEARNSSHQEYGEERLINTFKKYISSSAEDIRNYIVSSVQVYAGEMQQFDDMTVVVIKVCC